MSSSTIPKYASNTTTSSTNKNNKNSTTITNKNKKQAGTSPILFTNTRSALKRNLDSVIQRREAQRHEQEMRDVHRVRVAEEMGRAEHDPLVELRLQHELKTAEERHKELHGGGGGSTGDGHSGGSYANSFSTAQQEVIRTRQLVDHFRARAQIAQAGVVVVDTINALVDVDDVKLFPRPPPAPRLGGLIGGTKAGRSVVPLRQRPNFLKGLATATGDQGMADGDFMAEESRKHPTIDGSDSGKSKNNNREGDGYEGEDEDDAASPTQMLRAQVKKKNMARRNHIWAQYEEIAQRLQQGAHQQGSTHSSMVIPPRDENGDGDDENHGSSGVGSQEVADDLRALLRSEQDRIEATGRGGGGGGANGGVGRAYSVSNDGDEFSSSNDSSYAEINVTTVAMDGIGASSRHHRRLSDNSVDDDDDDSWSYCGCSCHNDTIVDMCDQCSCDEHSRSFSEDAEDIESTTPSPTVTPRNGDNHANNSKFNKNANATVTRVKREKKPVDVALQAKREELQKLRRAMKKRTRGLEGTPPVKNPYLSVISTTASSSVSSPLHTTSGGNNKNSHVDAIDEAKEALRIAHRSVRANHLLNAVLEDASLLLTSSGKLRTHPVTSSVHRPKIAVSESSSLSSSSPQQQLTKMDSIVSDFDAIRSVDYSTHTSDVEEDIRGLRSSKVPPSSSPPTDSRHKFKVWLKGVQFPQSQWKDTFESNPNNPEDFRFLRHYQPPEIVLHERADLISERIFNASTFVDLGSVGGGGGGGSSGPLSGATSGLSLDLQQRLQQTSDRHDHSASSSTGNLLYRGPEFSGSGNSLMPDPTRKGFLPSIQNHHHNNGPVGKGAAVQLCREPSGNTNDNNRRRDEGGPLSPPSLSNSSNHHNHNSGKGETMMMLPGNISSNVVSIGNFSGVFDDGSGGGGSSSGSSYHTDVANYGSGGAVAFGVPDNTSPYETLRLPPEFSSISTSKIAEVVASDACDMILATENIMRYVNACVKQGRRSGSVENEFDKMDRCALRVTLWSSECTQQTRRLVQGAKGIKSGIEHELSEKRKDVVDAVEDVANQNHKIAKLQNEVDSLLKEAKEMESTLVVQWSLLHSCSPFSPNTTATAPPPRRPLQNAKSPTARQHHQPFDSATSTRAQPKDFLKDFDTGLAALSRLRHHLIKWSILRGKNTATFNTTSQQQHQQQATTSANMGDGMQKSMSFKTSAGGASSANFGEMSGSIPNFGLGGGGTISNNNNNPSQRISMALSPLASLFSTKGAAAKLKAQQQQKLQQQQDVSSGGDQQLSTTSLNQEASLSSSAMDGGGGAPPQASSSSSPPCSPKADVVDNSVDAAFQALLGELVSRQKVTSLWREMVDAVAAAPSSPPSTHTTPPTTAATNRQSSIE